MKLVIALLAICQFFWLGAVSAKTNNIDKRIVIADIAERTPTDAWRLYPYNQYVYVGGVCTGQYVGENLILTAAHCIRKCDPDEPICFVLTYKGEFFADIIKLGDYEDGKVEEDWMLLKVRDPKFFSRRPFGVLENGVTSHDAMRAGFGSLRIIQDSELPVIKKLFIEFLQTTSKPYLSGRIESIPLQGILLKDFDRWLTSREKEGLPSVYPLNQNFFVLKAVHGCEISDSNYLVPTTKDGRFVRHFCADTSGDSGGAILVKNGQDYSVAGISSRKWKWGDLWDATFATRPELFYEAVKGFQPND